VRPSGAIINGEVQQASEILPDNSVVENAKSIYPPSMKDRAAFEKFGVMLLTTLTLAAMSAASPS
jgi:hypothetical protein